MAAICASKILLQSQAPESRQLLITPFDTQNTAAIGKAIERANLGFMPIVDGNIVRIKIPPMDEAMRKEMIKLCHKSREEAKVSIRKFDAKPTKLPQSKKPMGKSQKI